jgi:hypothetical protein
MYCTSESAHCGTVWESYSARNFPDVSKELVTPLNRVKVTRKYNKETNSCATTLPFSQSDCFVYLLSVCNFRHLCRFGYKRTTEIIESREERSLYLMDRVDTLPFSSLEIHLVVTLPSMPRSRSALFPPKKCTWFSYLYNPCLLHPLPISSSLIKLH